jgi:hypothetical protein
MVYARIAPEVAVFCLWCSERVRRVSGRSCPLNTEAPGARVFGCASRRTGALPDTSGLVVSGEDFLAENQGPPKTAQLIYVIGLLTRR